MRNLNWRAAAGYAGVWLLVSAALVIANWHAIAVVNTEIGDFSANSLLVLEAKRASLLSGHYSRFGFFHPGPVLLYVLAAGEWLAYDLLGLVPSPFSGQLIAVAGFDAFWIVTIWWLLRRVSSDWRRPTLATLLVLLMMSLADHEFINGLWFPLMYSLPFVAFVVAIGLLASGLGPAAPIAVLAGATLIHGHSSFIAIVGIMVVFVLAFHVLAHRGHESSLFTRAAWRRYRVPYLLAIVIAALFAAPLAINTIRHWPGPLAQYAEFGSTHEAHPVGAALAFVASYWQGPVALVVGVLMLIGSFVISSQDTTLDRAVRGLVVAIAAGLVAVAFYAIYGVDALDVRYLLYFSFALPALTVTVTGIAAAHRWAPPVPTWAAAVVCLGMLIWLVPLHWRQPLPEHYDHSDVPALAAAIAELPDGGHVVLDLDNSHDWGWLWSSLSGAQVYDARRGEVPFCIGTNWVLAFGETARCTPEQLASRQVYTVSVDPVAGVATEGLVLRPGSYSVQQAQRQ